MLPVRSQSEMTAWELVLIVDSLDKPDNYTAPLTVMLENSLDVGAGRGRATYLDQRHHWLRWLNDYQRPERPARNVYNAINCPTMLFWLAEALEVDRDRLLLASHAAENSPKNQTSQTAAIRNVIGWGAIHRQIFTL